MRRNIAAAIGVCYGFCALALVGCTNPYETRFEPNPSLRAETVIAPQAPTTFRLGTDAILDSIDMRDHGFVLLGRTYFRPPGRDIMENQARAAGAAEVILYTRYDPRDDAGPAQIGIGIGIGNVHYRNGVSRYDRAFSDPAPGYTHMATYWARAKASETSEQGIDEGGKPGRR